MKIGKGCFVVALIGALHSTTFIAHAAEPDAAAKAEAAKRFDRGLTLFDEGDNAGALAEFKQVYQTMPNPVVLYNIGLVYAAMGRPVDAVEALKQVATHESLSPAQKERAQNTLNDQQARIGRLTITTVPPGARISIDGVDVATTPLTAPLQVAAGSHVVGAVAAGYAQARKEVVVAGNAEATVNLELVRADVRRDAKLIVRSKLRGAELFIDGKSAGKTPLSTSLAVPAGAHALELRRPGYVTAKQQIELGEDATGEVSLDPVVDPAALGAEGVMFSLDVGEKDLELYVDQQHIGPYSGPVRLPKGHHQVRVEAAGFLPLEQDVTLEPGKVNTLKTRLEPTPETRAAHDSNVRFHRTMGWVGIGAGSALAIGGGVWLGINAGPKDDAKKAFEQADADVSNQAEPRCNFPAGDSESECLGFRDEKEAAYNDAKTKDIIGYVGLGVGGALIVTGVVFLVTGEDADRFGSLSPKNEPNRLQLSWLGGPDQVGVGLHGSF
jgi:hypothetical protein